MTFPASQIGPPMTVLVVDDEPLSRQRLRRLLEQEPDVSVVGECTGGLDALNVITHAQPELVFLDVRMPDLSGVGVVEALDAATCPEVVFVTAYDEYMERAFALHALDYLRKPFTDDRFASTLGHARRHVAARRAVAGGATDDRVAERQRAVVAAARTGVAGTRSRLPIRARSDTRWRLFDPGTIDAVEAGAGVAVHLHVGRETHPWDVTLAAAEQATARFGFVRVHRRWLINPEHVAEIVSRQRGDYALVLRSGAEVPTGRSYRAQVERALGIDAR